MPELSHLLARGKKKKKNLGGGGGGAWQHVTVVRLLDCSHTKGLHDRQEDSNGI